MPKTEKPKAKKKVVETKPKPVKKKNKGGRTKGATGNYFFKYKDKAGVEHSLTPMQKKFADFYIDLNYNPIDAVINAGYNCKSPKTGEINRRSASNIASENLAKPNIFLYINMKLELIGLNDTEVDKQLLYVMQQNNDLSAKNRAIDIYKKSKGAYAPRKHEHNFTGIEIINYGDKNNSKTSV